MNRFLPFKKQFDLEAELETIRLEVARIETIKELSESRGWIELKRLILDRVAKNDRIIISLAANPIKNENELRSREALRKSILGLIGCVDVLLGAEQDIQKRFKTLLRTAQEIAPSFITADKQN